MALTAGPYLPKSGWLLRWTKLAGRLMTRSAEALIYTVATVLVVGVAYVALRQLFLDTTGLISLAVGMSTILVTPIAVQGVFLIMAALQTADTGERPSLGEAFRMGGDVVLATTAIATAMTCVVLVLSLPAELRMADEPDLSEFAIRGDLMAIIAFGAGKTASILLPVAILHPFALPAVIFRGMSLQQIRLNDHLLRDKSPTIHFRLMMAVMFAGFFLDILPTIVLIPALLWLAAWIYVGGREVITGNDQNGTAQTSPAYRPASHGI